MFNIDVQDLIDVVTKPSKYRLAFMDKLMDNKSELNGLFGKVLQYFSGLEDFCKWYGDYVQVYSEWFRKAFEEKNVKDVLAMIPTISPWAFEGKCKDREMGELPEIFGSRSEFQKFCDKMVRSPAFKAFAKVKDVEVKESLYPSNNYKKDFLLEKQKKVTALLKEKMGQDFVMKCGRTKFVVKPMFNPFSNKVVLRLVAPDNEKYILKISPYNNPNIVNDKERKAHENQLIRADSPYSNACVDFYLKYNNCANVAEILYYDFIEDAVLYKEHECKAYHYPNHKKKCEDTLGFNLKELKCISDLGLFLNDVRENNLLINKKSSVVELIDSGHMSYISPLNPGCPGYTYTLGNLCGRESISHFGVAMAWMK